MTSARLFVIMRVFVFFALTVGFVGFMRTNHVEIAEDTRGTPGEFDSAQL